MLNTAKTKQELENTAFAAAGIAQKHNCALKRLDWQQEQGLMSSLPLGLNQVDIQRGLTTSSTAIFVPFTTCELFMEGQALYYGLNALSNNMIMADRKQLKNPKGLQCKGRLINRVKLQAVKPFTAQVERHGQEKSKRGNRLQGFLTYKSTAREKYFQKLSEKSSDLPPVFLLLVEGYCNPLPPVTDYALKKTRKEFTSIFYTKPTPKTNHKNERSQSDENQSRKRG